jgi:TatD DNase family protein
MFIDTHCHLDDPSLSVRLPEVLANGSRVGVERYIVPGVDPFGWERIALLADKWPNVSPAFGLHPMHGHLYTVRVSDSLEAFLKNAVAVGEIGLDYTLTDVSREVQIAAFRGQLRSAVKAGLPVIIHCRKAFQDLLSILREENVRQVGGVMHAFSGSPEVAWECIGLSLSISVAGTVTYRNAVKPLEVVRRIPLEYLLLETDAPDMTPEPYRGCHNEPAFIVETGKKVAEIKGVSLDEVAAATTANAERLFRFQ